MKLITTSAIFILVHTCLFGNARTREYLITYKKLPTPLKRHCEQVQDSASRQECINANKKFLIESHDLSGEDLSNQDLSGAQMQFANLTNTLLKNTLLKGADLSGAFYIKEDKQ